MDAESQRRRQPGVQGDAARAEASRSLPYSPPPPAVLPAPRPRAGAWAGLLVAAGCLAFKLLGGPPSEAGRGPAVTGVRFEPAPAVLVKAPEDKNARVRM